MPKRFSIIVAFVMVVMTSALSQETDNGPGFQMITLNNPAFSGSEGTGKLRLSYLNYFPGNNYNLHSVYISYDSYFPSLHGGAGFYLNNDYLGGIVNDLRGGLSYSYFLQAGEDLYVNAGLSASFFHRGMSFSGALLPDMIDPLGSSVLTSAETLADEGRTVFDAGAGFLVMYKNLFGGFSVSHLTEPNISSDGLVDEKLKRKVVITVSGDILPGNNEALIIRPQFFSSLQGRFLTSGGGAVMESKYLSINALIYVSNEKNVNMQTGFSFTGGSLTVFYNYRFNISSGNSMMPLSLMHQTGLAFSLNNVDKRNLSKTINFPKM